MVKIHDDPVIKATTIWYPLIMVSMQHTDIEVAFEAVLKVVEKSRRNDYQLFINNEFKILTFNSQFELVNYLLSLKSDNME